MLYLHRICAMWQTEATTTFTTHLLSLKSWENAIFAIYLLQAKRVSQIFVYTLHLPNLTNAKKTRPLPTLSSLQIWCKYVIWIEVNVTKVVRMRPLIHICNRFVTPVNPFFRPVRTTTRLIPLIYFSKHFPFTNKLTLQSTRLLNSSLV